MIKLIPVLAFLVLTSTKTTAWGPEGHAIVLLSTAQ